MILAREAQCLVSAVHVDHGLHPTSARQADAAVAIAASLGLECRVETVAIAGSSNLEARARDARREVLGPDALTGHTADDRAETLLVNLLRGTGPDGLGAMAAGPAKPLLALRRAETAGVGPAFGVTPLVDPTNADARFLRNRIRREVVPLLDDVAGRDVVPLLNRLADITASERSMLDELGATIDPTDARALATAPAAVARRAIRAWLTTGGYPPDRASIERVMAVASGAALACELPGGDRIERRHQRLRRVPPR